MATKKSKLSEKAARIPDIRPGQWDDAVASYLKDVVTLPSESARSHRFAALLQQLLGFQPDFIDTYCAGIEKTLRLRQKDRLVRGQADNLFGNVVIEFERLLSRTRADAERQLREYVAILWSNEPVTGRTPYICIASDGVQFLTFTPVTSTPGSATVEPESVTLQLLEDADWRTYSGSDVFYWLDRYLQRKEILPPTSETIVKDFGPNSHAYRSAAPRLLSLWHALAGQSSFAVIYDSWDKYLRVVYGSGKSGPELFVSHTYLATLAKLMAWMRVTGSTALPSNAEILLLLEGELFKGQGIDNFIEEDFFSWLARGDAADMGVSTAKGLFSLLRNYNLRQLTEDVLKSLYQELVAPATRHDLGEFYTPDWLAHRMVRRFLEKDPMASMLDPTCGSGTFLYLAIREKRARLGDNRATLLHILDSVCGADIHPLAVIVAKTNYLLALGDLIRDQRPRIALPVYLANTIRLPERTRAKQARLPAYLSGDVYGVEVDSEHVYFSENLMRDAKQYDDAVEGAKTYAGEKLGSTVTKEGFWNFMSRRYPTVPRDDDTEQSLFWACRTLHALMAKERDSIWAFVLKNIYRPLFFKHKFDCVIGNPPWIALRNLEPSYQEFLKKQVTKHYKLLTGHSELITHLEIATLFLLRAADLYLKEEGSIGFVLPKTVFNGAQHDGLRRHACQFAEDTHFNLFVRELWDCEDVAPLFSVPACVVMADKKPAASQVDKTIRGEILQATLKRKNSSLAEAEERLAVADASFSVHIRGKRSYWSAGLPSEVTVDSPYRTRFDQGATLFPRSFWFVSVKASPLGFNADMPPLVSGATSKGGPEKKYRDVKFEGNVESQFVYAAVLGDDILPFACRSSRLVVLPVRPTKTGYALVPASDAQTEGFLSLARWLTRAESLWVKLRGEKSGSMNTLERLDYRRGLTAQNPNFRFHVVYPNFQRVAVAAVIDSDAVLLDARSTTGVSPSGVIVESALYHMGTNCKDEAHYVCAFLNSRSIDVGLGELRKKGQKSHPNVHKKIFDVAPIPQFDPDNTDHAKLARLGEACAATIAAWLRRDANARSGNLSTIRLKARGLLQAEMSEIDIIVERVVGAGDGSSRSPSA